MKLLVKAHKVRDVGPVNTRLGWGIVKSKGSAAEIEFLAAAFLCLAAVVGLLAAVTKLLPAVVGIFSCCKYILLVLY